MEITGTISDCKAEVTRKLMNGENEKSFQIGGMKCKESEWEKMLKKFDNAENVIKEMTEELTVKNRVDSEEEKIREAYYILKRDCAVRNS